MTETWTAGELGRFLAHAAGHRLYAAWVLACSTGMRRSELLGVRWGNVDLEKGLLAVVDTVVPVKSRAVLRIGETKSRRSRRAVALDTTTVAVLRSTDAARTPNGSLPGPPGRNSISCSATSSAG